jgi:hypothetical protein
VQLYAQCFSEKGEEKKKNKRRQEELEQRDVTSALYVLVDD